MISLHTGSDTSVRGFQPNLAGPTAATEPRTCQIHEVKRSPFAVMEMVADPDRSIVTLHVQRIVDRVALENRVVVGRPHDDGETFIGSDARVWYCAWVLHRGATESLPAKENTTWPGIESTRSTTAGTKIRMPRRNVPLRARQHVRANP